ncbi:DEAD/DEAH box helicase [Acinetobacter baumannii]|uniref:DEAD/DEAH box helicase n=1 Tax=Acinetobacter baumannii TaxID=470 RepID=UPI0022EA6C97|nr:DEAD/DEAH box helicase [Acinetobacter baumannii]MDA3322192.1 DEAD/DEAH box helicase [Acinetobacter baumannii]MDA3438568.1 DEAD/DEAH box helicase [Acinetobacter baumannii]MDA3594664.1 DEAD/DEAH box helicase [Acinetobacter baumannii]
MTAREFKPRPLQKMIIDFILDHPRCAIYSGMGTGKTSATLTALDILNIIEPGATLVIAPLLVANQTWPDEVKKWCHLQDVKIIPIIGKPEQRVRALKTKADIYTVNYENLPWLVSFLGTDWFFTKVVADESTKLKGFRVSQGSVRARALGKVAHTKVKRFIELTGTPSPNGIKDLWGQCWFLDRGERLGTSFTAFTDRWFQSVSVGVDRNAIQLVPFEHSQKEIQDRLKDICISIEAKDYFDIKEPITATLEVELKGKARKLYDDMEKEMFIELSNSVEVEAFNAASKTIKCLQIASGAIYTDESGAYQAVHDLKIQALESVIEEAAGMPVLVSYHFKSDLDRLLKAFPQGRHLNKDPQIIRDWNAGKIPVLFAHPASAGHGLNLQDGGNILVFFSHWWDLEQYQQIVERIGPTRQAQAGHDRPVFIYHIVAKDTMDEVVMERRESKREVQDLLMESMKKREVAYG